MTFAESIQSAFRDRPLITCIEHYAVIESTNDRARELGRQGIPEIALISADEQTAGRGRQGRSWYTPPGTALAFSLLTRPAIAARHAMRLTMLAGLAAVEGIEQATGLRLDLKWPNDIVYIGERPVTYSTGLHPSSFSPQPLKVGGILTECAFQGDVLEYAVVGIGLNVNVDFSRQADLRETATSLMNLYGQPIDRLAVLRGVANSFVDHYAWLSAADELRKAWAARLINLQRRIRVQLGVEVKDGYAEGVDMDGALLLRTDAGQLERMLSGDVTLHSVDE